MNTFDTIAPNSMRLKPLKYLFKACFTEIEAASIHSCDLILFTFVQIYNLALLFTVYLHIVT